MVARYFVSPHGGRRAYPDITSALSAAAGRGRAALVEIAPGRYEESLTVQGEVQLAALGDPGSVVVSRPRGAVLDAFGSVRVHGLVLIGRDAEVVGCHAGTLTLEHSEIRAHNGVSVHARPNTSVTLRDSVILHGRAVFSGANGLVERCRFTDAADNAVAVFEGAHVSVRDSWIEGSRLHGVRVSDARAQITGCELTGTGKAAITADTRAELTVTGCTINAVHAEAIMFSDQSRGSVDGTRVTDAQHGITVVSGADPVVRGCVFTECRDTGINVHTSGRGRFEDCEVFDAGNIAVFSTKSGAPEIHGCRISRGNVGIAVTDAARGRFTRVEIGDLTSVALRVCDEAKAVFEQVRVERCPSGLETRGNGGTTADVTDAVFRDFDMSAAEALGQSRVTLKGVSAERGVVGFGVGEEAQLFVHDCDVTAVSIGGALGFGKARLVARNLTVTGSEGVGLCGTDSAYLDVVNSAFVDCTVAGASFQGTCGGRLVDCSVSGTQGAAVQDNGLVDLVSLRTSLPVVKQITKPVERPPTIVNNYDGPVFNAEVHGAQLAWNNNNVIQQQTNEDGSST
ncbi:right-handed parallel beta-helix repeat-containing protein [Actinacidiphila oryziradicis]|uniref:Right-handed parallel beta-helix repeat-containing protein n=1 Tax=Actinacidiphila oryziradicis TaxID=2571141 RepID=A0A4U0S4S8_9ACTN|nr:right-handed parallel beta-helix repeat-containing protein [Actinacidiphila oryziradicis]TKA02061.1 right-handed parallel beta-helix repeat-containing protein [Actinacidiphila oryziradicis]